MAKKDQARQNDCLSFWDKLKRAMYCKTIANLQEHYASKS